MDRGVCWLGFKADDAEGRMVGSFRGGLVLMVKPACGATDGRSLGNVSVSVVSTHFLVFCCVADNKKETGVLLCCTVTKVTRLVSFYQK